MHESMPMSLSLSVFVFLTVSTDIFIFILHEQGHEHEMHMILGMTWSGTGTLFAHGHCRGFEQDPGWKRTRKGHSVLQYVLDFSKILVSGIGYR
jgi:hypothetical protein